MDKRCLKEATKNAIGSAIVFPLILLLLSHFVKSNASISILSSTLIYCVGTHMGFCIGYHYKTISKSLILGILPIFYNLLFILIIVTNRDFSYFFGLVINFFLAYTINLSYGKKFYLKTQNQKNN